MSKNEVNIQQIGKDIVQAAPQLYIDLDVESDGIAGYGSLLSIGAVSPWGETFYQELKPASDEYIEGNRVFCENHGLTRSRLLREGEDLAIAMASMAGWLEVLTKKYQKLSPVLVAFNASYDFPIIDLAFRQAGIENPFGVAGFCIKSLAMAVSSSYDWRQIRKSRLPTEIIPEGDFTHNALEDAVYQQKIHFALVGKLSLL